MEPEVSGLGLSSCFGPSGSTPLLAEAFTPMALGMGSGVTADQMHGLMEMLGVGREEEQDERSKPPS